MNVKVRKKKQSSVVTKCLVTIAVGIVLVIVANNSFMSDDFEQIQISTGEISGTGLAMKESFGFFTDVTDESWMLLKKRFQLTQPNHFPPGNKVERWSRYSHYFWANNFEPEFTCPHEFRFGKLGDGGKWVCDPHLIPKDDCLVYSIGSNGNFEFETTLKTHLSKNCDIHTFDFITKRGGRYFPELAEKAGVNFHHWGISGITTRPAKTFKQTIEALKHKGKKIDIMKIDCEKCEYTDYKQWFSDWEETNVDIRQILIEVHNSDYPVILDIFEAFQEAGFVIFHKEANFMNEGKAVEMAFVKLSADFQKL